MAEITGSKCGEGNGFADTSINSPPEKKHLNIIQRKVYPRNQKRRAVLPNLVDIVATNDGLTGIYVLKQWRFRNSNQNVNIMEYFMFPLMWEHMPYLLPREAEVRRAYTQDDNKALFEFTREWHTNGQQTWRGISLSFHRPV